MLTDGDIINKVDFQRFVEIKDKYAKYSYIDFDYMSTNSNKTLSDDFNELLLVCKYEHNIKIFPVLVYLIENYMEPIKLKFYINDDVKWIIAEEIKNEYFFIENNIFNSTLESFFN